MSGSSFLSIALVATLLWSSPLASRANDGVRSASPSVRIAVATDEPSDKPQAPAKDAGSVEGVVDSIDYHAGKLTLKASTMHYDVTVLPSTSIQDKKNNDNFHTIADIKKGAHVQVMMSQRAGVYTAQIIKLL